MEIARKQTHFSPDFIPESLIFHYECDWNVILHLSICFLWLLLGLFLKKKLLP
jgi:hypothetical protein